MHHLVTKLKYKDQFAVCFSVFLSSTSLQHTLNPSPSCQSTQRTHFGNWMFPTQLHFHLRMETDPVSKTLVMLFSKYQTMDEVHKSSKLPFEKCRLMRQNSTLTALLSVFLHTITWNLKHTGHHICHGSHTRSDS
jgi:hypothetical protein